MPHQMRLRAFNSADKLLYEEYIPIYNWYEDLHFLLDDKDSKRAYYRVRTMMGEEINADGIIGYVPQSLLRTGRFSRLLCLGKRRLG